MSADAPRRVELAAPLEGCHVQVDDDQLDMGHLADMQSQSMDRIIGALARAVVGGDACAGLNGDEPARVAALRRMKPEAFGAVLSGVEELFRVPKRS